MRLVIRSLAAAFAALVLALTATHADAHGGHGGGHHHHGHGHWGVGIGFGFYGPLYPYPYPYPAPGYLVVQPPDAMVVAEPAPRPGPVFRPRSGQSAAQTEADRQECNRWATTQPAAMQDASVFHATVSACMEQRGYAVQ